MTNDASSRSPDDGKHVILAHDQQLFAVDLDLAAGVAGEDDLVPLLHAEGGPLAVVQKLAVTQRDHLAALGLLLGRVRKHDAALGGRLGLETLDEDVSAEGAKLCHDL